MGWQEEMNAREDAQTGRYESKYFHRLFSVGRMFKGVSLFYRFPNGYELSVVSHAGSYGAGHGKWEVMPTIKNDVEGGKPEYRKTKTYFEDDEGYDKSYDGDYYNVDLSSKMLVDFFNEFGGSSGDSVIGWVDEEQLEAMMEFMEEYDV